MGQRQSKLQASQSRHEGRLQRAKRWIFFIFMLFICSHGYVSVRSCKHCQAVISCPGRIKANPSVMIKIPWEQAVCQWAVDGLEQVVGGVK
jgi:hypothetical protein